MLNVNGNTAHAVYAKEDDTDREAEDTGTIVVNSCDDAINSSSHMYIKGGGPGGWGAHQEESLSVMKKFHYRQAYLYFIYKVISIEAPKSNFQGIPLLPDLPVDKKQVRI